jgi:hypothetical protein
MRYTDKNKKKSFAWSYSKLKNYRTCPKRYYKIDVEKTYQEDFSGEHLAWGKQVHTAFEKRIGKGAPFPKGMENFEDAALRLLAVPGKKMVEQQLAIRKDLSPCGWFDDDVWFRSIADYLCVNDKVALAIDYKTGKIVEDSEQLALMAECVFSHYPQVEAVRTEFWWLKDEAATREDFKRSKRQDTWRQVLPEVTALENAHKTLTFPAKQSGLCRNYCIVTECPHNGRN